MSQFHDKRAHSKTSHHKPIAVALGTALAGGLALSGSAFAINPLAQGYLLGAQQAVPAAADKAKEGSCGASMKMGEQAAPHADMAKAEDKCGEGKCGMQQMDTDKDGRISSAEFAAAHGGDVGKFTAHDTDHDGFISASEIKSMRGGKSHEGKCGDGNKMGADKAAMEGKCGEGKCGGQMKADER